MEINSAVDVEHQIEIISRRLDRLYGIDEQTLVVLKRDFPQLRFALCSEDDTSEREPYRHFHTFDLHLLSGGDGCLGLTHDIDRCRGLVIALRETL